VAWWCGGFFTDNNTTPTKVVLSCLGLLVGLWQLSIEEQFLQSIQCFYLSDSPSFRLLRNFIIEFQIWKEIILKSDFKVC
jgi:hypothetical protein